VTTPTVALPEYPGLENGRIASRSAIREPGTRELTAPEIFQMGGRLSPVDCEVLYYFFFFWDLLAGMAGVGITGRDRSARSMCRN
jgi:hypothetical protein